MHFTIAWEFSINIYLVKLVDSVVQVLNRHTDILSSLLIIVSGILKSLHVITYLSNSAFSFLRLICMYFESFILSTNTFRSINASWKIDPIIIINLSTLSLVIFIVLKSTLSKTSIATSSFFWLLFFWYIFLVSFYF